MARAVKIRGAGGVDVLSIEEVDEPVPGTGEVLVEVCAAGLNRADCLQRRGFYPAPPGVAPDIPGLEYSGVVAAVGAGVSSVAVGDRVMGITAGAAMATHLVAHERTVVVVPDGLDLIEAAAIPEVFFTAFDALVVQGRLSVGQTVLIHSVASGVGTAATQIVRSAGAVAIGTSRSPEKLERCRDLGVDVGIVVEDKEFADAVQGNTGKRGVDLILDTVGAAYLDQNIRSLASGGHLIIIGLLGGVSGSANLGMLLAKRASITGTVLRSRPLEEKSQLTQRFCRDVVPLFARGLLKPVVDRVMPMSDIGAAHALMERNETFGKLVMSW